MANRELVDIEINKRNKIQKIQMGAREKHPGINEMRFAPLEPRDVRGEWLSSDVPVWLWGIEGKGILHLREVNQYSGELGRYVTIQIGNESPYAVRINPFTALIVKKIGQDKLIYCMCFEGNQAEHIRIFDPEIETQFAAQQAVLENPTEYWEQQINNGLVRKDYIFKRDGRVWGDETAIYAVLAAQIFNEEKVNRIYVPGCAYGRKCIAFARFGMNVIGADISKVAKEIGQKWVEKWEPEIRSNIILRHDYALKTNASYDGVFLGKVLHQFIEDKAKELVNEIARIIKPGGLICVTTYHRNALSFGYQMFIDKNIFDERGWRPVRFYNEGEVDILFQEFFDIIEEKIYIEPEEHSSPFLAHLVSHYHQLVVVYLRRKKRQ